jgi:RNA recognition motif-containing protein
MTRSLYVGNLPWSATEDEVHDLFARYGEVYSVTLKTERETGRSRGFGFVEIARVDAAGAVDALNGYVFCGRPLRVNEAAPKAPPSPRGPRASREVRY